MCATKRICIIGAGASGIASAKACKEQNLDYVIYESSSSYGGLWRYRDSDIDGVPSVSRSTIINTSKEMSAFSDFPPNPNYPNFMHNSKMVQYLEDYAREIDCLDKILLQHKVVDCRKAANFDIDGRWEVETLNLVSGEKFTQIFDGIMVCTGHHVHPLWVQFPGQDKFKGKIMHTHSYKNPDGFKNKSVVVVGIGNSGGDAAVELGNVAKKVYLSTRRGAWVSSRVGPFGQPFDQFFQTRLFNNFMSCFPNVGNHIIENYLNLKFNHELFCVKPKHRYTEQHVMFNDNLHNSIVTGKVIMANNIKEITENGVIFDDNDQNTIVECDCIIMATGYDIVFPFLDKAIVHIENMEVNLFKFVFNPYLGPKCHTLGFIGLCQPSGPLFPVGELQARWYASLMAGLVRLPSEQEMFRDIALRKTVSSKKYYKTIRHTLQCVYIDHLDEVAHQIGCKPKMFKYFFLDFKLWFRLMFGPSLSYQYRLEGPNKWSGARSAIMNYQDRVVAPLKTRKLTDQSCKAILEDNQNAKKNINRIMYLAISLSMFYIYKNGLTVEPVVKKAKIINRIVSDQISYGVNFCSM